MRVDLEELSKIIKRQVSLVDEVLTRYTEDEAGQNSRDSYLKMNTIDKLSLLTYTLENCSNFEDFETELVINFDYNCY